MDNFNVKKVNKHGRYRRSFDGEDGIWPPFEMKGSVKCDEIVNNKRALTCNWDGGLNMLNGIRTATNRGMHFMMHGQYSSGTSLEEVSLDMMQVH